MPRRVIANLAAFGIAYIALLTGCSLMVGLTLGMMMRPAPSAPLPQPTPVEQTATDAIPSPRATSTPGSILIFTFTPRPSLTPRLSTPTPTPPPTLPPASDGECSVIHVVEAGDTVLGIAQRYNVAVDDIMRANELETASSLRIGQKLVIPICGTATPAP